MIYSLNCRFIALFKNIFYVAFGINNLCFISIQNVCVYLKKYKYISNWGTWCLYLYILNNTLNRCFVLNFHSSILYQCNYFSSFSHSSHLIVKPPRIVSPILHTLSTHYTRIASSPSKHISHITQLQSVSNSHQGIRVDFMKKKYILFASQIVVCLAVYACIWRFCVYKYTTALHTGVI